MFVVSELIGGVGRVEERAIEVGSVRSGEFLR